VPEFGKSVGSMKALKAKLKKSSGGANPITTVPKQPGSITVRFLQEPDEFKYYEECWDEEGKRMFPYKNGMVEGVDFTRKSTVYLANALNVDTDKVIAFQVKQSVLNTLVIKYEKYGTLLDRDYEIAKYGTGLETEYDVEPQRELKRNLSKYQLLDLHKALKEAFLAAFPDEDDGDDDDDDETPRRKVTKGAPVRRKMIRGGPDEDEEEDEPRRSVKKKVGTVKKKVPARTSSNGVVKKRPISKTRSAR
jgi:hypothetical protein